MSVLIRGMEMPKSCYACMFFAQTNYWNKEEEADILSRCKMTGEKTWESVNGYLPNCPLVPVPGNHGRLIDADALKPYRLNEHYKYRLVYDADEVANAPTIVRAEEGE